MAQGYGVSLDASERYFEPERSSPRLILDDVRAFIRRFVVLDEHQADAVTLWAAATHVFEVFACTPYLHVSSAEKRSGKSLLLDVLALLVRDPLPTASLSEASLFRAIEKLKPTVLIDEVDAVFGSKSRDREELRGILNAGYRRGAVALRMGGPNNTELQKFNVYCPKAFAGIGDSLPDTIADRAIPIRLKRRTRDEPVERFRLRVVEPEGLNLRDRLAEWLEPNREELAERWPVLPDELDDRAQDVWEGLLALAEIGGWSERARAAALALMTGAEREDDSITFALIRDISTVFTENGDGPMRTVALLDELHRIAESPWAEWHGRPLTAHGLSRLLKPYRIKTMPVYADGETVRGYKVEQFSDAFAQLSVRSVRSVRSESSSQAGPNAPNASNASTAESRGPAIGDDAFLPWLFARLEQGLITEGEWHNADHAHRLLVARRIR
jgi:hypothetical protein